MGQAERTVEILDAIQEARRYARVNPAATEKLADRICERLILWASIEHLGTRDFWARHSSNVNAGLDVILADHEVIQGYLYAAHAEIKAFFDRKERERERAERETA